MRRTGKENGSKNASVAGKIDRIYPARDNLRFQVANFPASAPLQIIQKHTLRFQSAVIGTPPFGFASCFSTETGGAVWRIQFATLNAPSKTALDSPWNDGAGDGSIPELNRENVRDFSSRKE